MQFYILLTLLPLLAIGIRAGVDRPATAGASPMEQAVTASSRVPHFNPFPRSYAATGELVAGAYLGSTMSGYFLTKLVDSGKEDRKDEKYGGSCTIVITNTMTKHTLINPTVFLSRGSTKDPSPYKIESSPDGSKTQFIVFNADDEFGRLSYVSHGVLAYEIVNAPGHIFAIAWKVERNGKFIPGAGKNSFSIAFGPTTAIDETFLATLMTGEKSPNAATVGGYVKMLEEYRGEFQARAHMTNNRDAQLIVSIEDANEPDVRSAVKRDFGVTFTTSLLSTVAGVLTTTALRYLPFQTQVIVVTLANDFKAVPLEDPKWHLKNVVIYDYVPFEIGPQEQKQVTFRVPFAYGEKIAGVFKSAAVVLTFKIKNSDMRLALAIWWKKKLPFAGFNEYSTFLISENVGDADLKSIADDSNAQVEKLPAGKLQKYRCTDGQYTRTYTKTQKKTFGVTLMAIMGDSSESGMKVHISDLAPMGPNAIKSSVFRDCFMQTHSAVL